MTTPDGAQMMVGDTQWLDGLAGWKFFCQDEDLEDTSKTDSGKKYFKATFKIPNRIYTKLDKNYFSLWF